MIKYFQTIDQLGNCRVFQQPEGQGATTVAQRWDGVWQIGGLAVIRDERYIAILEATDILWSEA
jgi:hypothetical protein